jgi:hypothetical protein
MTTHLALHHVGEAVVSGLLAALDQQQKLTRVRCSRHPECSVASVLSGAGLRHPRQFAINTPLAPISMDGKTVRFDGAHAVDVLCHDGQLAVGIEAKLGFDRLSTSTFTGRFLSPLGISTHASPRINGSMTAILAHRRLSDGSPLALRTTSPALSLAEDWFLIVRRDTWMRWSSCPELPSNTHVALFEEIAESYGNAESFDQLVLATVGTGFHSAWRVS